MWPSSAISHRARLLLITLSKAVLILITLEACGAFLLRLVSAELGRRGRRPATHDERHHTAESLPGLPGSQNRQIALLALTLQRETAFRLRACNWNPAREPTPALNRLNTLSSRG